MIRRLFGVLIVMFAVGCAAGETDSIRAALPDTVHCGAQVVEVIRDWRGSGPGRPSVPAVVGSWLVRFPTDEIGVWLVAEGGAGRASVRRIAPDSAIGVGFGDDCVAERASAPNVALVRPLISPALQDVDIAIALQLAEAEGQTGVMVYLWAPHMPLSVDGYPEAEAAAVATGLRFEPALVPGSETAFVSRTAEEQGFADLALRAVASVDLVMRDALVHAPTIVVYAADAVTVLPGYRDRQGYVDFLSEWLTAR